MVGVAAAPSTPHRSGLEQVTGQAWLFLFSKNPEMLSSCQHLQAAPLCRPHQLLGPQRPEVIYPAGPTQSHSSLSSPQNSKTLARTFQTR